MELNGGKRLKGMRRRRRRGEREERVVAEGSDNLEEDLEEERQPAQQRPPHLLSPMLLRSRVHLRLSQLAHATTTTKTESRIAAWIADFLFRAVVLTMHCGYLSLSLSLSLFLSLFVRWFLCAWFFFLCFQGDVVMVVLSTRSRERERQRKRERERERERGRKGGAPRSVLRAAVAR